MSTGTYQFRVSTCSIRYNCMSNVISTDSNVSLPCTVPVQNIIVLSTGKHPTEMQDEKEKRKTKYINNKVKTINKGPRVYYSMLYCKTL